VIAVTRVTRGDLDELLPLMRGYCHFYDVSPTDDALLALARTLITDPEREGVQLIARSEEGAVGFATIYWSWATSIAARIGVMNDLFVSPAARGTGAAEALIRGCLEECRQHRAAQLTWQTAPDNERAQRLYDRLGAKRSHWVDYSFDVSDMSRDCP
jgi:ribosomal protein S18 acetylase RimI-like enzyme